MIRRFETYAFLPGTPDEARLVLAEVLGVCGHYIPEVLHNAVGWNASDAPAELVWEHAYESPESYRRYMVHPYHADMIDRYVLPDSPERTVEAVTGAGLFGYHTDSTAFVLPAGSARRVVLLRLEEAADADSAALVGRAEDAARSAGAMSSSLGANSMANSWFDGETPIAGFPQPKWTHIWELGFSGLGSLEEHLSHAGADLPRAIGAARWTELCYEVTEASG